MKIMGEAVVRVEVGHVVVEKLRVAVTDLPVEGLFGNGLPDVSRYFYRYARRRVDHEV
jgi:hypothetical protein